MRLKELYISQYKNLRDFSINFDGSSFIDVFVGKNGTGKSNLFEALIEIFRHIVEYDRAKADLGFSYRFLYEIDDTEISIEWSWGEIDNAALRERPKDRGLIINGRKRSTFGKTQVPDNVLIYYSGHNDTVAGLVAQYEETFSQRIKRADFNESRFFIGIGPEYKELLLAVLLMQQVTCKARQFICQKLGIVQTASEVRLVLARPEYAADARFDIELNDVSDRYWKSEGITKTFLDRLHRCINTASGSPVRSEGYFASDDRYVLYFGIDKIQQEFLDLSPQELFRQLDNLKTLGMLAEITIPFKLENGFDASVSYFSDGQFQSVYIYSITELFKDRNCITLLDEPDSFLHPEWQFEFLKQIFEITEDAVKSNHVLMSSHSASTITSMSDEMINLFELNERQVKVTKRKRSEIIKALSAGMITFTENEARLNISHVLNSTSGAVLFTEGITDELIIESAWSKLFPGESCPFEIQNAFDRIFLRNMFSRDELKNNHPDRTMFALFDFDEAYDDWNGLQKRQDECTDPFRGLSKQLGYVHHYAILLPIPNCEHLKPQVLKPDNTPWGRGRDSHISIEHLFYESVTVADWFKTEPTSCGGQRILFTGEKVRFAKELVPTLDATAFEVFRPMFEFIKSKCSVPTEAAAALV
ncbi:MULTISPECIES: AAA family ATPase [Acinetobacter]|uniref:AAA family ATPase n=1 Tax=Acinetobacter TaxID=469 RepID=UPI00141B24B6|nr:MULTISPECIES: AAA family ATPase [Acinetobacter]MCS4297501.1 ABC-type cobalamin/Fe3+-siderophores transport system ATPase subunit [Acinetobacter guillouiae]MCW2249818.1 ABC-type cobalamin/Fe3+-siderophores transport system ATPase subunit [Acinetobacter sp. BIGb0204]NII38922.1 ABC-type cobalamin/Fe3+-siderophores transport system ATPase subunit [Acinetobacter sp. BIGb0196]